MVDFMYCTGVCKIGGPLLSFVTLALISIGLGWLSQFIFKKLTDQEKLEEIEDKTQELKEKMEGAGEEEKLKLQKKMMELSSQRMKLSLKPMLVSTVVFLSVFPVLKNFYLGFVLVKLPFSLPIIKKDVGWFLTYLIFSMISNTVFKKLLKNHA